MLWIVKIVKVYAGGENPREKGWPAYIRRENVEQRFFSDKKSAVKFGVNYQEDHCDDNIHCTISMVDTSLNEGIEQDIFSF